MTEIKLSEKINRNPNILEEKIEEMVNDPSKFQQMLVETIPKLIIDGLATFNKKEANDDKEEELPRKKRSFFGGNSIQFEQRKCNLIMIYI